MFSLWKDNMLQKRGRHNISTYNIQACRPCQTLMFLKLAQ